MNLGGERNPECRARPITCVARDWSLTQPGLEAGIAEMEMEKEKKREVGLASATGGPGMLSHRMFVCAWMHVLLSTEGEQPRSPQRTSLSPIPTPSPTPHTFHGALYESVLAELQCWWEFRF